MGLFAQYRRRLMIMGLIISLLYLLFCSHFDFLRWYFPKISVSECNRTPWLAGSSRPTPPNETVVKLEDSPSPVRVFLRGPFLSTSLASMTNISTSVTLVGVLNQSSGELLRIKEILRVPTVSLNKSYGFSDSVVDKVFSFHQFGYVRVSLE